MILDRVLWLGSGRKDDSVGDSESLGEGHYSLKAKGKWESARDKSLALRLAWLRSGCWVPASAWAGGLALPWVGRAKREGLNLPVKWRPAPSEALGEAGGKKKAREAT